MGYPAKTDQAHHLPLVECATKNLRATPGYRIEEGECGNCERTTLTIRVLWTGW